MFSLNEILSCHHGDACAPGGVEVWPGSADSLGRWRSSWIPPGHPWDVEFDIGDQTKRWWSHPRC